MSLDGRDEQGRWLPGHTGNPNGRPKFSIVSIIRDKLEETPEGDEKTYAEKLVHAYIINALENNDGPAIRDLIDRFDGKAKQAIDHTIFQEDNPVYDMLRELIDGPQPEAD